MKNSRFAKLFIGVVIMGLASAGLYQWAYSENFTKTSAMSQTATQTATQMTTQAVTQIGTQVGTTNGTQAEAQASTQTSTQVANQTSADEIKSFTLDSLQSYNGSNGKAAYIAVDGIVYDVTQLGSWENGMHNGYQAGQDLTEAFASSPHAKSILDSAIVVGKIVSVMPAVVTESTTGAASVSTSGAISGTTAVVNSGSTTMLATADTSKKVWDLQELAKYNGENGSRVYIAVNDVIYDVTDIGTWTDGVHKGIRAGQDVTKEFNSSPHMQSLLSQLPVVAKLGEIIEANVSSQESVVSPINQSISNSTGNLEMDDDDDRDDDEDDRDDDDGDEDEDEDDGRDDDDDEDEDDDRDDDHND